MQSIRDRIRQFIPFYNEINLSNEYLEALKHLDILILDKGKLKINYKLLQFGKIQTPQILFDLCYDFIWEEIPSEKLLLCVFNIDKPALTPIH